jgi:voltage-gated potassium channel
MGYGDIYPVTTFGRMVTMLSSVVGIAIVALPAGIITAGYMKEISDEDDEDVNEDNNKNNDNKKDNEDRE